MSIVLAAILLPFSCEKENPEPFNRITGKGEIVEREIHLEPFSRVILDGVANLYIRVGEKQSITLKAQQNIMDVMNCKVSADALTISLKEGVSLNNHEEIRLEISVLKLHKLLHSGIGNLILEGIKLETFEIDHRGIGDVHAYRMPVNHCVVLHSGTGSCMVKAIDELEVDISALGDVYYKGSPQITLNDTGLGDLINANN